MICIVLGDFHTVPEFKDCELIHWQESEVSAVKYIPYVEYKRLLAEENSDYVPYDVLGQYGQLFDIIEKRYATV